MITIKLQVFTDKSGEEIGGRVQILRMGMNIIGCWTVDGGMGSGIELEFNDSREKEDWALLALNVAHDLWWNNNCADNDEMLVMDEAEFRKEVDEAI